MSRNEPPPQTLEETITETLLWVRYGIIFAFSAMIAVGMTVTAVYLTFLLMDFETDIRSETEYFTGNAFVCGVVTFTVHGCLTIMMTAEKNIRFPEVLGHVLVQIAIIVAVITALVWWTGMIVQAGCYLFGSVEAASV